MIFSSVFLQAGNVNPGMINLVMLLLLFSVFYFFFIRPQAKKQKEQSKFLEELNKGDEVALSSGIIGRVNKIEDNIISIQVDQKTFLRVVKGSISKEMTEALQAQGESK